MKKIFTLLAIGLPVFSASITDDAQQNTITKRGVLEGLHAQIKQVSDAAETPDIELVRLAFIYTPTSHPFFENLVASVKTVITRRITPETEQQILEWFELALQPRTEETLRQIATKTMIATLTSGAQPSTNMLRLAFKFSKPGEQLHDDAISSLIKAINTSQSNPDIGLVTLAFEYYNLYDSLRRIAMDTVMAMLNRPLADGVIPDFNWAVLAFKNPGVGATLWPVAVDHVTRVFVMAERTKTPLSAEWYALGLKYMPRNQ